MPQAVSPSSAACAPVGCASVAAGPSPSLLDADRDRARRHRVELARGAQRRRGAASAPSSSAVLDDLVARAAARARRRGSGAAAPRPRSRSGARAPPSPAAPARSGVPSSRGWSPMGWPCGHALASASRAYMRCSSDSEIACSNVCASSCTSSHGILKTSQRNASIRRWRDTTLCATSRPCGREVQALLLVALDQALVDQPAHHLRHAGLRDPHRPCEVHLGRLDPGLLEPVQLLQVVLDCLGQGHAGSIGTTRPRPPVVGYVAQPVGPHRDRLPRQRPRRARPRRRGGRRRRRRGPRSRGLAGRARPRRDRRRAADARAACSASRLPAARAAVGRAGAAAGRSTRG